MSNISILGYLILAVSIGYSFLYPMAGEVSTLQAEKDKYNASLAMTADIENKKNELLTEFNNISAAQKKDINTILPSSFDFVRLVSQIDAVAGKHGISIDKISSKDADQSVGENVAEAQPQPPYHSAAISFSFEASYEEFNAFMGELEKSLRILDIKNIKLEAGEGGAYTFEVEFETYWL